MHEDLDHRVTDFLSDAWLATMADAAGSTDGSRGAAPAGSKEPEPGRADGAAAVPGPGRPGDELVIQQVVLDGPGREVAWFVVVDGPRVRVGIGRHRAPAITFTQDASTAAAIGSGRQSAQGAFMAGQLRVGGDVRILLDRQEDLARLDDVFAAVRATTRFPEPESAAEARPGPDGGRSAVAAPRDPGRA